MYFRKQPHIANFDFVKRYTPDKPARIGSRPFSIDVTAYRDGVFRVRATHPQWKKSYSQAGLTPPPKATRAGKDTPTLDIDSGFGLTLRAADGQPLLTSPSGMSLGVSGRKSIFVFHQQPNHQFYGMGEKMRGLELSGTQTKFWNTDIFADFHFSEIEWDRPDPMYVSIPYLIIKQQNQYVGLLLNNPYATFMSTSSSADIGGGQMKLSGIKERFIAIGAEHGMPDLYMLVGPSLAELTRKLQRLVGVTPLPPAWALGYHQCRWGYRSAADLKRLDDKFREHQIPCDGLWLDIDYMDAYKVFTFNKDHFPDLKGTLLNMAQKGRKIVPILDPGVKREPGYPVYDSGRKEDVFCRNPQGKEFIGLVWPGETAFPDYSTKAGRAWWARHVKAFARRGMYGAWLDMNDPSTGPVDCLDMRFNKGKDSHYTFHNQYALGMARASRDGFLAAHPDKRPFLLSRSGFTGIGKYSALWTGDNVSNYHYLRNGIAVSLNLALSGVPFNGPDIGGFARDTNPQLLRDWMKACFLFPFCRNHTEIHARDQEPWVFDAETREIVKHYIQLRYKMRPYLYNLFAQQEETGEAIIRPLFYDFEDSDTLPLGRIDDQLMIGPALLHAPILSEHERSRTVVLPGANSWYSPLHGKWIEGGNAVEVSPGERQSPLFLREGGVIPMTPGAELPTDQLFEGRTVDFHIFLRAGSHGTARYTYVCDDGESFAYRKGKRSRLQIEARVTADGTLAITTDQDMNGYGAVQHAFVLYDTFPAVSVNGRAVRGKTFRWECAGTELRGLIRCEAR